ncbi:MAG TPA: ATP-binding cassette domain-containing protein, partial [Turneriella sp.]|nr:ATP-binding cassette domain-containing protein [Turneriella sp.]HNN01596.1 ATP-binding cassette domain-containing protein [Turneriella sp.]
REIRFTDVSFGYRENQSVLRDISLVLKPSRIYAIVGESGIGKTTLIDLLCRFYQPQLGHISLNGVQSDRYDLAAWRAGISIVTQDAILFDGSVRENLLISSRPLSDAQLLRALRGADAQDFIDELPQGLDTLIGERGFRLSGGQKHRLTLARALVKGAPVLVLDEATAHLDSLSEQKIRVQLDKLKKNRVVIMITHRLSTVTHADEIIVLNGGSVEAIGTHRDLLRRSRTYKRLWSAQ